MINPKTMSTHVRGITDKSMTRILHIGSDVQDEADYIFC